MLLLALTACIENNLGNQEKDPTSFDSGTTPTFPTEDSTVPPPPEECNGKDDDGDGDVDEGFPDVDLDGEADCTDDTCVAEAPLPRSETDPDCEGGVGTGTPPANPWSTVIEWQHLGNGVVSTPAVGDLDGDGVPEVVYDDDLGGGRTVVLDGATGTEEWSVSGMDPYSGPSLGDIDGDGYGDVVTSSGSCFGPHVVYAYDASGALMWQTAIGTACETYANLVDLDGDGEVEVIMNEYVLDGATGGVEFTLDVSSSTENWGAPAVADMDQDGDQEIMLGNALFETDGSLIYTCGWGGTGAFPQPVNADGDPEGELLVAGYGGISLCDDDGGVLWSRSYSSYGTAVAVADFDNDGVQEYAFAKTSAVTLYEPDGSARWSTAVTDASGLAGTTSWDVNYDGVPEVVYADEVDILVLDGTTGAVVIRDPNHGSWTAAETPAVADVDGDGQGELIYGSNSGYLGITVIGGAEGDWPYSRPVYNQYTYYSANVEDDLSIPTYQEAPWIAPANLFRGQPSAVYTAGSGNAKVSIADVCVASCEPDGRVDVWVQVWNDGALELSSVELAVYGIVGGVETEITRQDVGPLAAAASVEVLVSTTTAGMGSGLVARVDEADRLRECDESDNEDTWTDRPCP